MFEILNEILHWGLALIIVLMLFSGVFLFMMLIHCITEKETPNIFLSRIWSEINTFRTNLIIKKINKNSNLFKEDIFSYRADIEIDYRFFLNITEGKGSMLESNHSLSNIILEINKKPNKILFHMNKYKDFEHLNNFFRAYFYYIAKNKTLN